MSFKVMAICAGRHGGNGEALAKEALCAVREAGGEVELINLFDYNILPCTGCEGCTMQMGKMSAGLQKEYHGCVLKNKDDVDAIINEIQTCQGVIISVPTYDLTPSSVYTRLAQRFLAYELSFRLAIGDVKENPHTVAGLISVGGSMHDWQSLALESLQATMFTMSMQVVDRYMAQRDGRPGNCFVWGEGDEWGASSPAPAGWARTSSRPSRPPSRSAAGWATLTTASAPTATARWSIPATSTGTASSSRGSARSAAPAATS